MVEKTKIYKDKINQMTRQMEDQKEVIKSKDNAIENLLTRMDELTAALTSKNDEISTIKYELTNLKEEFEVLKNERKNKNSTLTKTKSLSATANNSQSREREKQPSEVVPTHKKDQKSLTLSSKGIENLKKSSDPFQLVEKLKIQAATPKPVFQSYDFNDRLKYTFLILKHL
jgi:chromosome segregation ATPase